MPVPLRAIVAGELAALLVTVTLPETLPAAVGAKATLKEVDCPEARVKGSARPLTANPLPVTLSCDNVMFALPVLLSVTVCVALAPVATLPKLSDVGEAESCRTWATPVPDKDTARDEVGELLTSVSVPENVPAAVGAKLTVKGEEVPGETVRGRLRPEKAKPAPESEACLMIRLAVPGFDMVSVCVPVAPVLTAPKLTEAGETEING